MGHHVHIEEKIMQISVVNVKILAFLYNIGSVADAGDSRFT